MFEKHDAGMDEEIFEERAVYLGNVDELIFETLEIPMITKRDDKRHIYHDVFEEIEMINHIEVPENIAPVGNIEIAENLFQKENLLNGPGNNML